MIKFPEAKPIDWSKYIEPKKSIVVTKNHITTALLVSLDYKEKEETKQ